jgi:hypothetical protein
MSIGSSYLYLVLVLLYDMGWVALPPAPCIVNLKSNELEILSCLYVYAEDVVGE